MITTNKVACFYTQLKDDSKNIEFTNQCAELLDYWKKSWEQNGWEAYVLDEDYLDKQDKYYINLKFDNFYESNLCKTTIDFSCEYTRACYLRWFAYYQFAKEHGVIFHADYDALNYGFTPDSRRIEVNRMLNHCNSAGKQNKFGLIAVLDTFLSVQNGEVDYKLIHPTNKTSDLFVSRSLLNPPVNTPRICMAPNERLMLHNTGHLSHGQGRIVDYHNGIKNKPSESDENLFDISYLIQGQSRIEAIKTLEKHFHLRSYE